MQIVKRGTKGKRGFFGRNEEDDQQSRYLQQLFKEKSERAGRPGSSEVTFDL